MTTSNKNNHNKNNSNNNNTNSNNNNLILIITMIISTDCKAMQFLLDVMHVCYDYGSANDILFNHMYCPYAYVHYALFSNIILNICSLVMKLKS